ncbi:MAG: alpha/beta hydrolase [Planctomycetota bacterium]|nr:alpha/beta hydrolase [Planctomycetota bacterium]
MPLPLAYCASAPLLLGLLAASLCVLAARAGEPDADGTNDTAAPNNAKPDRKLVYREVDGVKLEFFIFEPPGHKPADARPALVFFHGGGWRKGDPSQFYWQARYLSGRGMVCFSARYRLIPNVSKVEACIEDAKAAVAYIRAHAAELGVDPAKLAAGGGSAGGHLAAACAVTAGAPAPGEASCRPDLLVLFNPALFHPAAQGTLKLEQFTKETPPAIFFLGTEDDMLNYAKDCLARSKQLGNEVRVFTAADQGHGFFNKPPWRESTTLEADRFLARHGYLQGEPTLAAPPAGALQEAKE